MTVSTGDMFHLPSDIPLWLQLLILVLAAAAAGLVVHWLVMAVLCRAARRTHSEIDDLFLVRLRQPLRLLLIILAIAAVQPSLTAPIVAIWQRVMGMLVPALFGWMAVSTIGAINDIVLARTDVSSLDNLEARRRRTRAAILHRIAVFIILLVTFCMMLVTIPSVRSIGVTLIASAGLAALAVGAAAQPALRNLIAGLQMAFTEPIRIDDVVIVDGEWGNIEQIGLTYVVVKIWDDRRLVVPLSRFLEESFQNWTRETSRLLGSAFIHVDLTADVTRIRAQLEEIVRPNPKWDKRVVGLQVTDLNPNHMELRALVSAANAGDLFDLRCDVREALTAFIAADMPEALPRRRSHVCLEY